MCSLSLLIIVSIGYLLVQRWLSVSLWLIISTSRPSDTTWLTGINRLPSEVTGWLLFALWLRCLAVDACPVPCNWRGCGEGVKWRSLSVADVLQRGGPSMQLGWSLFSVMVVNLAAFIGELWWWSHDTNLSMLQTAPCLQMHFVKVYLINGICQS